MQFGDLRPSLKFITDLLRRIDRNTGCGTCDKIITSAGTGSVPAGLKSVSIVKTSNVGTVTITLSDGSTYALTVQGEGISDAATPNAKLPAYAIATADAGTWKWHGIK